MNSEKVKEIKKALECCKRNEIEDTCEYCSNCPANNWDYETECNVELFQNSLTLINELESENERLKNCIATLERKVYAKEDYYNAVKDRALEVFAQRVKMEFYYEFDEIMPSIMANKIDKILKELQGK